MLFPGRHLLPAGALVLLISLLYAPVVASMARQWWEDPNWSHGFLVPVFSAFVLWRGRRRWLAARGPGHWMGLVGAASAVLLLILGSLAAELSSTRLSLVLLLASLVVYLEGWRMLRAVFFPVSYLLLMIPWPAVIYAEITLPLQFLASRLAAGALAAVGIPVLREGNLLILSNYTLEVAEACSGIRSLVSLVTLAVAYAYLAENRAWIRIALVLLMLPIAIVSNAFRIFGTGVLTAQVTPKLAEGFFHEFSGWLIFLSSATLMLLVHWLLKRAAAALEAARA